jgi:hypothetical protein
MSVLTAAGVGQLTNISALRPSERTAVPPYGTYTSYARDAQPEMVDI